MAGVPEEMIMKIQGWKDPKMDARYLQASKDQIKEWQEKGTVTYLPKRASNFKAL
tara:strand:+ start:284 stop:448 length:165 start_codon:yes stop_codon:yes gene_type:complete